MYDATFTTNDYPFNIIKIQVEWPNEGFTREEMDLGSDFTEMFNTVCNFLRFD